MKIRLLNTFSVYLLLLFPPMMPFVGGTDLSKQVSLILLLMTGSFLLCSLKKIKFDLVFALLFSYALFCFLNTVAKQGLIEGSVLINDIFESIRVVFIAFFYLYGFNLIRNNKSQLFESSLYWKLVLLFSALVMVSFILKNSSFGVLSSFYNSKAHRFSGLMPGINYVWFPLAVITGFGMLLYQRHAFSKIWFILATIVILGSLVLSASFTSIICFFTFLFLMMALFYFNKYGIRAFFIVIVAIFISGVFGFALLNYLLDNSIGFSGKFRLLLVFIENGDLSSFSSLSKRFDVWSYVFELINEKPLTGYGSSKSGVRYTDNSYVMTLYRYGIIGLLLEISVYLSLIFLFLKRFVNKENVLLSSFAISLIVAYLISGITANSFYELKLPYVFFTFIGCLVCNSSGK